MYPQLSATVLPYAQEIRFRRGDSLDIPIQIQNDQDPPDPIMIGGGIVRWAAKQGFGTSYHHQLFLGNESAFLVKRSYDPGEIEMTEAGSGRAILHLPREDTMEMPTAPAVWDLEVTLPTKKLDTTGAAASVMKDSDVVSVSGINLTESELRGAGDMIQAQGRRVLVLDIVGPSDLLVDFRGWETERDLPFDLHLGSTKTVAAGPFRVLGDVTV